MIGDKEKMAKAILGKMKPAEEQPKPESDEIGEEEGLLASAGDFKAALESGDAQAMVAALKSFVEQCG